MVVSKKIIAIKICVNAVTTIAVARGYSGTPLKDPAVGTLLLIDERKSTIFEPHTATRTATRSTPIGPCFMS